MRPSRGALWLPPIVWMGVIFALSSLPKLPPVPGLGQVEWGDKVVHAAAYAILGALLWRALAAGAAGWSRVIRVVLIAAAYGVSDELHQRFVPGRELDPVDLAADVMGAAAAAVVLKLCTGGDNHGRTGK